MHGRNKCTITHNMGRDSSVGKLSNSYAEDQGLNPGGGFIWFTPITGWRLPAINVI